MDHKKSPQPSSVCLKVSKGIPLQFTGFGAQYGPQLLSLPSLDSCVKRAKVSASDKSWLFIPRPGTRLRPSLPWLPNGTFRGMGLLFPFFHVGFLEAVAIRDPKRTSNGGSIWPSLLRKTKRGVAVTPTKNGQNK